MNLCEQEIVILLNYYFLIIHNLLTYLKNFIYGNFDTKSNIGAYNSFNNDNSPDDYQSFSGAWIRIG